MGKPNRCLRSLLALLTCVIPAIALGQSSPIVPGGVARAIGKLPAVYKPKTSPPPFKCNPVAGDFTDCPTPINATSCTTTGSSACTDLSQVIGSGHDDPNSCGVGVSCRDAKLQGEASSLVNISSHLTTIAGGGGLMDCPASGIFASKPELAGLVLTGLQFLAWSKTGDLGSPQMLKLSSAVLTQFVSTVYNTWLWGTTNDPCSEAPYFSTLSVQQPGFGNPAFRAIIPRFCSGMGNAEAYYNPENPATPGLGFEPAAPIAVVGVGKACCYFAASNQSGGSFFDPRSINAQVNDSTCEQAIAAANWPAL